MIITPDQAQNLLDGATPGPWAWQTNEYDSRNAGGPNRDYDSLGPKGGKPALETQDGEDYASWVNISEADKELIAAAPDLAQTIAGMRWEYAVEHLGHVSPWGSRESAEDDLRYYLRASMFIPHLVRRLVGPAEPIAKETSND